MANQVAVQVSSSRGAHHSPATGIGQPKQQRTSAVCDRSHIAINTSRLSREARMQPGEGILTWLQIKGLEMSAVSSPPGEQITSVLQCDLFELERAVTETRTSLRATLQEQAPWVKAFRNS